ncbi:Hypothetical predicted protein [Cloeon dipterum]|uniref:C-type lectin domain-containing protein n=1 Tax=Cloeon dipterum TaxID=197152 RepID=A0A8S1DQ82_9INSE|nr:Hypothetical predicted protein [Cloeon dipterum]
MMRCFKLMAIFCILLLLITVFETARVKKQRKRRPNKKLARAPINGIRKTAPLLPTKKTTKRPTPVKTPPTQSASKVQTKLSAVNGRIITVTTIAPVPVKENHCETALHCIFCDLGNLSFNKSGKAFNDSKLIFYKTQNFTFAVSAKQKVSWMENWKICYSLGMQPVMVANGTAEQRNLLKIISGVSNISAFWIGAYIDDSEDWVSCEERFYGNFLKPIWNQPELDKQNCATTTVEGEVGTIECASQMPLTCQSMNAKPADCTANCSVQSCNSNIKRTRSMEDLYQSGRWIFDCDSYYFFSSNTARVGEARETCCSLGGKLASFASEFKSDCFSNLIKVDYDEALVGDFWTSASSVGCNETYRWCYGLPNAYPKDQFKWNPSGNIMIGDGPCVSLLIGNYEPLPSSANSQADFGNDAFSFYHETYFESISQALQRDDNHYLNAGACNLKKRFICELKLDSLDPKTSCRNLLGISDDEFEKLKDEKTYTKELKCYLRCLMDLSSITLNNELLKYPLFKFSSKSDKNVLSELTYSFFEKCGNAMNHTNPCTAAYNTFLCFKENAPIFYNFFKKYYLTSKKALSSNVPRNCQSINQQSQQTFNTAEEANGTIVTDVYQNSWFKSQFKANHDFLEARKICRSLNLSKDFGYDLPSFINMRELREFSTMASGELNNNFIAPTYTDNNTEYWCNLANNNGRILRINSKSSNNWPLDVAFVNYNEFETLMQPSFLYMPKGSLKFAAATFNQSLGVNFFYCRPQFNN